MDWMKPPQVKEIVKKPFLRRRSGLSRFYPPGEIPGYENGCSNNLIPPSEGHQRDGDGVIEKPGTNEMPFQRKVIFAKKNNVLAFDKRPSAESDASLSELDSEVGEVFNGRRKNLEPPPPDNYYRQINDDRTTHDDINLQSTTVANHHNTEEEKELELFELMEQITTCHSFCSTSSVINRFVNTDLNITSRTGPVKKPHPRAPNIFQCKEIDISPLGNANGQVSIPSPPAKPRCLYKLSSTLSSPDSNGDLNFCPGNSAYPLPKLTSGTWDIDEENEINFADSSDLLYTPRAVQKMFRSQSSLMGNENNVADSSDLLYTPRAIQKMLRSESNIIGSLEARVLELEIELEDAKQKNEALVNLSLKREKEFEATRKTFEEMRERELRIIDEEKMRLGRKKELMIKITKGLQETVKIQPKYEELNKLLQQQVKALEAKVEAAEYTNDLECRFELKALEKEQEVLTHTSKNILANSEVHKPRPSPPTKAKETLNPAVLTNGKPNKNPPLRLRPVQFPRRGPPGKIPAVKTLITPEPNSPPIYFRSGNSSEDDTLAFDDDNRENKKPKSRGVHFDTVPEEVPTELTLRADQDVSLIDLTQNSEPDGMEFEEEILPNGEKQTRYANGTIKVTAADGSWTRIHYFNGDIREEEEGGTLKYYYAESSTWETTFIDGVVLLKFANGQTEKRNQNGRIDVTYMNGCRKSIYPNGKEECTFPDGSQVITEGNGDKTVFLTNGQKEVHTKLYSRRFFPNGTIRTVYADNSRDTVYPEGRYRKKDSKGNVVFDGMKPAKRTEFTL